MFFHLLHTNSSNRKLSEAEALNILAATLVSLFPPHAGEILRECWMQNDFAEIIGKINYQLNLWVKQAEANNQLYN